jgi:hypothetical protein
VELSKDVEDRLDMEVKNYSMLDEKEELYETVDKLRKYSQKKAKGGLIKSYFSKSSYFQKLFPLIKEQKPGIDLYAAITLVQFIIIWYLIAYYTEMDTEGTQNLENSS